MRESARSPAAPPADGDCWPGPSPGPGDRLWPDRMEEAERVRGLAARLLGARETREVAFVENTSTALSLVAEGLDWRPGDNVVGAALEFPSNVYPWMGLASRGVEYRRVEERDGRIDPDEPSSLIDPRTRMLALSWVQYASGFLVDLARLGRACRERGVLFVVDVIQGLGALPLDVEADFVDVAAGSAHKWLLGPGGDRAALRLRPRGRAPAAGALRLALHESPLPVDRVRPHLERGCQALRERHAQRLRHRGPGGLAGDPAGGRRRERSSRGCSRSPTSPPGGSRTWDSPSSARAAGGRPLGIVTAVPPGRDAQDLVKRLDERGIVVAARAGRLRIAPHFYNTAEEIERCLSVLREIVEE